MTPLSNKSRFIQLMWLTWAFALLGLDNGILGPTLLDLANNVGIEPRDINVIFPAQGLGFIIGISISSLLVKLNYLHFSIGLALLFGSVVNILIPVSRSIVWLAILIGMQGLAKGFVDIFVFTLCLRLFRKQRGWHMLLIPISASFSSFVIPFVVQPFQSHWVIEVGSNITSISNCTVDTCLEIPSRIIIPYSLTAVALLPPIIAFFVYATFNAEAAANTYHSINKTETLKVAHFKDRGIIILLTFLFHVPVFGSVIGYSDMLTLYGTSKLFGYSKSFMAYMTALFWGFMLIGRLFNMVVCNFIHLEILLRVNFVGLVFFATILLIHQETQVKFLLWVGTIGYGFFQSSFLPSVIAWISTFMELDSVILSTSLIANAIGELFVPYMEALSFTRDGRSYLMFVVLAISVIEAGLFVSMSKYKRYWQQRVIEA